ncbi:MAG TPA: PDZ domain-containing protein [Bacteroidota bacterium]|nr:PDZ domain-containing protein [Bacteroidota bacterium]
MKNSLLILVLFLGTLRTVRAETEIHYTLGMSGPQTHLLEATIEYKNLKPDSVINLIMPAWRTGRYIILDLANGVQEFSAQSDGHRLAWQKTDKNTWTISTGGCSDLTVRYKVYANEFGTRTRGLNDQHAFVDGSTVFMYSEQYRSLPVTLTVHPYRNWHVTTGLDSDGSNTFVAPDYDYFIDCPMEIGTQKDFSFDVDGVPHVLSIFGEGNWNADTLIRDISKIVKAEKEFWGGFPYKRFVFMVECDPNFGGGTEHLNSTEMQFPPFVFRDKSSYQGFVLNTVAHEFFHTWNVKRLRPKGIHPYDFTKENYSHEYWIAEGTTSYYADVIMSRTGFTPLSGVLSSVGSWVSSDRNRPGNLLEPVAEASFDTWIDGLKGQQQSYNSSSDIYERGSHVSCVLDLEIRQKTSNKCSLDEVMREMYRRFPLDGSGYTLTDLQRVITELSGWNCAAFFGDYIYGTKPLPWDSALAHAGLSLTCTDTAARAWMGVSVYDAGGSTKVGSIVAGSPAYQSGLDVGDELLAFNDYRVRSNSFGDRIGELKPGDKVVLTVFHDDVLRAIPVTLGTAPRMSYSVAQVQNPTDLQKLIFENWLGMSWKGLEKK